MISKNVRYRQTESMRLIDSSLTVLLLLHLSLFFSSSLLLFLNTSLFRSALYVNLKTE